MSLYTKVTQWVSSFLHPIPYGYKRLPNGTLVPIDTPVPDPEPDPEPPFVTPVPDPPAPTPEPSALIKVPLRTLVEPCSQREMRQGMSSVLSQDEPWIYAGSTGGYDRMYPKHREILRVIVSRVDARFPRPGNMKLVMGDAGGGSKGIGHPTHNGYDVFDGNYYTLTTDVSKGRNMTHYFHYDMLPMEYIWREPRQGLIKEKFDLEKNREILTVLDAVYPRSEIRTYESIKQYLGLDFIIGDWSIGFNHWRHWHITKRLKVNWDALV